VMGATRRTLRRIPLEGLRNDPPDADMAPIRLFIGDREYIGRAAVRVFDPLKAGEHLRKLRKVARTPRSARGRG
jgi:hypothetical protein